VKTRHVLRVWRYESEEEREDRIAAERSAEPAEEADDE